LCRTTRFSAEPHAQENETISTPGKRGCG